MNTLAGFRRRGIDACTRQFTYGVLRRANYSKLYEYIHGDNNASLNASRRLMKPIGRVCYIRPRGFEPIMIGVGSRLPKFSPTGLEISDTAA